MKRTAILVTAALLAAGAAHAQQPTPDQAIAFLDKDSDGKVSLQEYLAYQVTRIAQFDANNDGVLSEREFHESLQGDARKNAQKLFDAFNTEENKRGLTQREYLGYHAYVFKTYVDTDKDGFMSSAEWAKVIAAISAQ